MYKNNARTQQHMLNQRKDWQFKQASKLAKENDAVWKPLILIP